MRSALAGAAIASVVLSASICSIRAADMTIEQSALLYDLLETVPSGSASRPGSDAKILDRALARLDEKRLRGQGGRPKFSEAGLLENYGKALFLGPRAAQFTTEIGHIHDLVARGDRRALEEAISNLWAKAGRTRPNAKALEPIIASLYDQKGEQPAETVRHVFEDDKSRIEVIHARAGGRMQVDVETKDANGVVKDRTVISGVTETTPTVDGRGLQRNIKLEKICTSTEETDKRSFAYLDGTWMTAGSGKKWLVNTEGTSITLQENRDGHEPFVYRGTFTLGRIQATHPITKASDMEPNIPIETRRELATKGISFRVNLEFCGDLPDSLRGTWSSQHVTYNSISLQVSRIHDPYDLSLTLQRDSDEKSAEGAERDEML